MAIRAFIFCGLSTAFRKGEKAELEPPLEWRLAMRLHPLTTRKKGTPGMEAPCMLTEKWKTVSGCG